MEIYLIRHGECFPSSPEYFCEEKQTMNPPLTSRGIEQARKLAGRLKNVEIDNIYSSDLVRAIDTANILRDSVHANVIINKAFREIDNIQNRERIAIVCHGGTIRCIVCGVLRIPQQRRFYLGVPPENCSISIVIYKEKESVLHTFNDYTHITG